MRSESLGFPGFDAEGALAFPLFVQVLSSGFSSFTGQINHADGDAVAGDGVVSGLGGEGDHLLVCVVPSRA